MKVNKSSFISYLFIFCRSTSQFECVENKLEKKKYKKSQLFIYSVTLSKELSKQ